MIELYERSNFRCDCGNSRFNSKCSLNPDKDEDNNNVYNHNFFGYFCRCNKEYSSEDMIECISCHEWFHFNHLIPPNSTENVQDQNLICLECAKKHSKIFAPYIIQDNLTHIENLPMKKIKSEHSEIPLRFCPFKSSQVTQTISLENDLLLDNEVLKNFCQCLDCKSLYKSQKIDHIFIYTDEKNQFHEELNNYSSDVEDSNIEESKSSSNLNDLFDNRIKELPIPAQFKIYESYGQMKETFKRFLSSFLESDKVISVNDVQQFLKEMKECPNKANNPSKTSSIE